MSIMKNVKYKQTGGVIAPGLPDIDTSSLDSAYQDVIDWSADPQNIPQYYTAPTVAQFDPLQTQAQQGYLDASGQFDDLTQQLIGEYQSQLDPNSAINQQLANQATQSSANAFFGAGTPGSARGQYAGALASQDAVRANRQNALNALGAERGNLTGAADIVGQVGKARRDFSQAVTDEDIKRFNYGQLAPQQFADRVLGLASQKEALEKGLAGYDVSKPAGGGGLGIFGGLLSSALGGGGGIGGLLGSLFNKGGAVYRQDGGPIDPGMDPGMEPPMDGGGPEIDPMLQEAVAGGPVEPPMTEPAGMMDSDPMMDPAGPMTPPGGPMTPPPGMGTDVTSITAVTPEETSEIDKIEGIIKGLAMDNPNIKVKRKKKGGK